MAQMILFLSSFPPTKKTESIPIKKKDVKRLKCLMELFKFFKILTNVAVKTAGVT
jgi:hypothetical protein